VLDNRDLTPQAMLVSVYQLMQQTNAAAAETSWKMSGEIGVARRGTDGREGAALPAVRMEGMMAPSDFNPGAINAALLVADRFSRVYGNSLEQPVVTGVRLRLVAIGQRRVAVLDSARLSRTEASAGETVEVEAVLRPFGEAPRVVQMKLTVPADGGSGAAAGAGKRRGGGGPAAGSGVRSVAERVARGRGGGGGPFACERPVVCDDARSLGAGGAGLGSA